MFIKVNCYVLLIIVIASADAFSFRSLFKAYDTYTKDTSEDFTSTILKFLNETKPWLAPCAVNFIKNHPRLLDMSPRRGDRVVYLDKTILDVASNIFKRENTTIFERLLCQNGFSISSNIADDNQESE